MDGERTALKWLLLVVAALAMVSSLASAQPAGGQEVSTPEELLAALNDTAVSSIAVMKPMALPHDFGPVTVSRQLLISSPIRAIIDWCDETCNAGKAPMQPFIILRAGAMVTFNRIFFRNFIPHSSSAMTASPDLDFKNSPVPFVVSHGGQSTYNLIVLHWLPSMFWVYEEPSSYWAQAAVDAIFQTRTKAPIQFLEPELYTIKSFSTDGSATVVDCYMPLDVDECLTDQPFNTTLVYCPYSFKDSLKNPWVDHVVVFHNIGLDRLVNSYRNPAAVNRTVEYISCPGTRHIMDLDNITSSVVVTAGGSLTFRNMIMQGSKSQNKTDWPSSIPLLLSTFKPIQTGSVILRDSTVRVPNMNQLIEALSKLPNGSNSAVEVPDLQPNFNTKPRLGDKSFVIKLWQLQQQRWLTARVGGNSIMDKLGSSGMASWQFFNVTVAEYQPEDCFGGAYTQGSVQKDSYSTVSSGQQLVDQLTNNTARHIRIVGDITLPGSLPPGAVAVNRIVEVRSCHPGGTYTVDWNSLRDAVMVSGHVIFEGDVAMTGVSWSPSDLPRGNAQVVNAMQPVGLGVVEYEDLTVMAEMPPAVWGNNTGHSHIYQLLGIQSFDELPLNMSLIDSTSLLLRSFYLNRSYDSNGQVGLENFLDVKIKWSKAEEHPSSGAATITAIVVPVVVGLGIICLLGLLAVCITWRRRAAASRTAAASSAGGKGELLPRVYANATGAGYSPDDLSMNNSDTDQIRAGGVVAQSSDTDQIRISGIIARKDSGGIERISTSSASKARSGPSQDIVQACRNLVLHQTVNEPDELVLLSVLGEGSYGKVFKATWKGTTVAVKIMVLPAYMTGKEKREKMAIMETAISSSLSHPNVVQTYTYAVEPVRSNTSLSDRTPSASGPGASISMHDSTCKWGAQQRKGKQGDEIGEGSDGSNGALSWEVRLVQEFCDLGSLRDALKQGRFRDGGRGIKLGLLIDTALDVARAMAHLHSHNILHSDLKARNILLRSDAHDSRGFAAKVADFGLSLTIDPQSTHVSNAFQGTMTHMAPETLMSGQISRASDVYAYGVLLWELYTGDHAYQGVPRALLGHSITKQGMRPTFPTDTPFDWQFLSCRCWETDPAIRPTFEQILQELKRMKAKLAAPNGAAASPTNGVLILRQLSASTSSSLQGAVPLCAAMSPRTRQISPQQLPSIEDISDTLPTELDRQLWEQQHQQTLQQQQQQRQDLQHQRSSTFSALGADGSAGAGAALSGGTPGYSGPTAPLALARQASALARQDSGGVRGDLTLVWRSPLYSKAVGQQQQQQSHSGDGCYPSVYIDDRTELPPHIPNVHSTMIESGGLLHDSVLMRASGLLFLSDRTETMT